MSLDVDSKRRYYNLDVRDTGSVAAKMKDSTLIEDGRLAAEVFLATIKVSKHPLNIFISILSDLRTTATATWRRLSSTASGRSTSRGSRTS